MRPAVGSNVGKNIGAMNGAKNTYRAVS